MSDDKGEETKLYGELGVAKLEDSSADYKNRVDRELKYDGKKRREEDEKKGKEAGLLLIPI